MKYRKKIFIAEDKREMYYNYFDTKKSKTMYRFRNLTLYMNNDISVDIENVIDKEVRISKRYDNTVLDGFTILPYNFYVHYAPLEKCNMFELFNNMKILSDKRFVVYLAITDYGSDTVLGNIEIEIDLSNMNYDSFYISLKQSDSNIKKCEALFWHSNKNDVSTLSESFQLLIDINKYKKIVINDTELPSELIDPEHMFNYQRFLLRNV